LRKGHVPLRTCLGCTRRFPKSDLLRLTLGADGPVAGSGPGRGYYVCRRAECLEKALSRRGLSRLLKRPVGEEEAARLKRTLLETESSPSGMSPPESEERR
jgi:hypothetical protein